VHRSSHYNPVTSVLTPAAPCLRYLLATDGITLPIMALRSAHVPGDYDQKAKQQYQLDHCICCDMEVISVQDCITDHERRWRHIQHVLTACRRRRQFWQPIMSQLRADIDQVVGGCQPARAAMRVALCGDMDDLDRTHATCIPYFLDPVCESPAPHARLPLWLPRILHWWRLHGKGLWLRIPSGYAPCVCQNKRRCTNVPSLMNMAVMVHLMMKCGYVMTLGLCLWPKGMLKVPLWNHHRMKKSG
jgi:hypothetical protein